jgi:hypothetical protein
MCDFEKHWPKTLLRAEALFHKSTSSKKQEELSERNRPQRCSIGLCYGIPKEGKEVNNSWPKKH